jgi:hypothetical protein
MLTTPITCRSGNLRDPALAPWQCVQHERRHAAGVARRQLPGGALCSSSLVLYCLHLSSPWCLAGLSWYRSSMAGPG